jgi:2-keto-4-pentenoate hydratase/2-oxohepta-3-ene-1,7-dioic acid hydratase in catechol pathway
LAAFHDVSVRDPHFKVGPRIDEGPITWVLQKNFADGSALGPWVVVDEDLDAGALAIVTRVNGDVRQRGNTSEMVYGFGDVADYLARCIPLLSGDVIASGTPAGTAFESGLDGAYLQDGDVVEIAVEGVGVLVNQVAPTAEHATWQVQAAGTGAP